MFHVADHVRIFVQAANKALATRLSMFSRLALLAHALAVCSALQPQPSRPGLHTSCARPRTSGVFAGRKGRPSGQQGGVMGSGQGGPKGPPEDGSSLFYLYCRAERKDLWYPVSVLQSDSQAQGLISAWLNAPLAKGVFKVVTSAASTAAFTTPFIPTAVIAATLASASIPATSSPAAANRRLAQPEPQPSSAVRLALNAPPTRPLTRTVSTRAWPGASSKASGNWRTWRCALAPRPSKSGSA